MQSVELYNPNNANFHLTPFASLNSMSDDVNPLNYQLGADDFIALVQPDGQLLYTLDPSTTTSLFWALHRLARYITKAASHGLHGDTSIPFASKGYIPQSYFDQIQMQRPDILTIQEYSFLNPLCGYTTRENLAAWFRDFQALGRVALQWIQTAQQQTRLLGLESGAGWNWGTRHSSRLEYPERRLIANREEEDSSDDDLFMDDPSKEKCIVLHPIKSTYAARYPNFDAFAEQPLVNNGYVDDDANTIDYYNTLFTYNDSAEE